MTALFGDSVELAEVERLLTFDWRRFGAIAFIAVGFEERWLAAVEELFWLYARYHRAERDDSVLEPLLILLAERCWQLRDPAGKRAHLMNTLFGREMGERHFVLATALPATREERDAERREQQLLAMGALKQEAAARLRSSPGWQSSLTRDRR